MPGSRGAVAELLPGETAASAVVVLDHAITWLATLGVHAEAVMTDTASGSVHRQYGAALAAHGLRHLRIRPYTPPRTTGSRPHIVQHHATPHRPRPHATG
jgi:hypothetical protein